MKRIDNTIILKSYLGHYKKEKNGEKPNTTRIIDDKEAMMLRVPSPNRIRIILSGGPTIHHFEREITDISHIGDICGKAMITIS